MQWKNAKLVKLIIRSKLGGNLRLRVPNDMKSVNESGLKKAVGENKNPFYRTENIAAPVISPKAVITSPQLKQTWLYDIMTQKGKLYTFIANDTHG